MTTTEDFVQCVVCQGIVNHMCRCSCGYADPVADERLNQPSGISGQLQQTGAADRLNEPFGDSEQLGTDAASGGDALDASAEAAWKALQESGYLFSGEPFADAHADDKAVMRRVVNAVFAARQPVGVEPVAGGQQRYRFVDGSAGGLMVECPEGEFVRYTAPPAPAAAVPVDAWEQAFSELLEIYKRNKSRRWVLEMLRERVDALLAAHAQPAAAGGDA
ncbi:hypothetical protein XCY_001827 [Xanthomonas arboricola pv. juglandis]|uniref:hypothetical protein n=1 Tax=Xanthomonas arboricola TaxID=56448 RepID=UPI001AF078CA|nr:hypothetical protein [Xanthomonas arboricola]CAG2089061.1 hypothetical protein XCY_001827 [Xanthomonas arboricola pv. juglandis]